MAKFDWPKFQKYWFPVILYSGIIFCVSSIPNLKTPLPEVQFDKFLHVLEYLPFGFLLARLICHTRCSVSRGTVLTTVALGSLFYGLSDEMHQMFVPGRDAEIIDVIAAALGGLGGGYIFLLFSRKVKKI